MYRILSILFIGASLFWLFNFAKKNNFSIMEMINSFFNSLNLLFADIKNFKNYKYSEKLNFAKKLFYLVTLLLFLIMTISSMIPSVLFGDSLSGIFLLIHVTAAPIFALFLAVSAILYSHSFQFNKNDFSNLPTETSTKFSIIFNQNGKSKLTYWLFVLFSIPLMISTILNMFPLFGTDGQLFLLEIHRYSALILIILVIFHSGLISAMDKSRS